MDNVLCRSNARIVVIDHTIREMAEGNDLVIDELLCFVQSKIDILDLDLIVKLCEENPYFDNDVIEKSKETLFNLCHNENDKTERKGRKGEHKGERNLKDICNLLQEKGEGAPKFVAQDLNILPPVTFKSIDVSILLHTIRLLQTEVKVLKDAVELQKLTSQDLYDTAKALDTRVTKIESPLLGNKTVPVKDASANAVNVAASGTNPGAAPFASGQLPTYSAMAQLNCGNNTMNNNLIVDPDGFIVVGPNGKPLRPVSNFNQRRNSQMKQTNPSQGMVGNSTRSAIEAASRIVKANVFVSQYPPETTEEEVIEEEESLKRALEKKVMVLKLDTTYSFNICSKAIEKFG